jgi:hypothetical protein
VILVSATPEAALTDEGGDEFLVARLRKPIKLKDLLAAISAACCPQPLVDSQEPEPARTAPDAA